MYMLERPWLPLGVAGAGAGAMQGYTASKVFGDDDNIARNVGIGAGLGAIGGGVSGKLLRDATLRNVGNKELISGLMKEYGKGGYNPRKLHEGLQLRAQSMRVRGRDVGLADRLEEQSMKLIQKGMRNKNVRKLHTQLGMAMSKNPPKKLGLKELAPIIGIGGLTTAGTFAPAAVNKALDEK